MTSTEVYARIRETLDRLPAGVKVTYIKVSDEEYRALGGNPTSPGPSLAFNHWTGPVKILTQYQVDLQEAHPKLMAVVQALDLEDLDPHAPSTARIYAALAELERE